MSKTKKSNNAGWRRVANFFGVLGYLSIVVEWTLVAALYLPLLIENDLVREFLLPNPDAKPKPIAETAAEPSILLVAAAVGVTFFVVVASVVLLLRLPLKLARTSHKVIEKTAVRSLPIITHHRKISKKKQKLLTARVIVWLKVIIVLLPLLALCGAYFVEAQLSSDLFVLIGTVFAISALVNFTLQYLISRWRSISSDQLL